MTEIKGICPIAAAPFTERGAVDEESFQSLVRHLLGTGVRALTLFGLATEYYKLDDGEKERLRRLMLRETSSRADVAGIVSVTDHSWEVAARRAREIEDEGADAIMLMPPFFLGPGEAAVKEHIRRVARAVSLPVIVQYAPAQTGVRIAPEAFAELAEELPNFRYVKVETQPPGPYVERLSGATGGALRALVGYAGVQMPDALARGAAGVQPGCSFSEVYVELYRLYEAGDGAGFDGLFGRLLPFISYWMQGVELIIRAEKLILKRRGIIASDYCRAPAYDLDGREVEMVERFLEAFAGLLDAGE